MPAPPRNSANASEIEHLLSSRQTRQPSTNMKNRLVDGWRVLVLCGASCAFAASVLRVNLLLVRNGVVTEFIAVFFASDQVVDDIIDLFAGGDLLLVGLQALRVGVAP